MARRRTSPAELKAKVALEGHAVSRRWPSSDRITTRVRSDYDSEKQSKKSLIVIIGTQCQTEAYFNLDLGSSLGSYPGMSRQNLAA